MQPLGNNLLVKPFPPEEKTKGGIIIPDSAKRKAGRATVVAISIDKTMSVQPGDVVLHDPNGGAEVNYNDEPHLLIEERSLWMIV